MSTKIHYFNKYFTYSIPVKAHLHPSITLFFGKLIFLKPMETNVSIGMADKTILDRKFQSSLSMPLSMIETIDKCKGPMVTRSRYVVSLREEIERGIGKRTEGASI
jgi:hypothetical protein